MGGIGTVGLAMNLPGDVVRRAALFRKMQLPEVFQAGRFFDDVLNGRTPCLAAPLSMIATRGAIPCTKGGLPLVMCDETRCRYQSCRSCL
jgi:hypothetical protein